MHPANWRCANGYLEEPFDSHSGQNIAYAKFDSSGSVSSGSGSVIIADRDGSNRITVPQAVRVSNTLYGAFHAWIEKAGRDYLVFANQQDAGANVGVGYICTTDGAIVAEFPGVPRTNSPDGIHCAHSNHESERTANDCSLHIMDMWAGTRTKVADLAAFQALWPGAVPTTWNDIGTKHAKWSPGGRYIAVTYVHEPDTELFRRMALWDAQTETLRDLFDYSGYHHQVWHPNGYEMCMVQSAFEAEPSKYVAYNVETDEWRTLIPSVSGTSSHGSVSPDGTMVATDQVSAPSHVHVWKLGSNYPASRKFAYLNAALDSGASLHAHTQWSRDSKSILFGAENNRLYRFFVDNSDQPLPPEVELI